MILPRSYFELTTSTSVNTDVENPALQYVFKAVQDRTLVNKVRKDYVPHYEQELTWKRLKSAIEYLSFIKDTDSAAQAQKEGDAMYSTVTESVGSSNLRTSFVPRDNTTG